jgi:NADH-quinone oxidoreductase subunit D
MENKINEVPRINFVDPEEAAIYKALQKQSEIIIEDKLENTMVLNMGPQHPATHGVLRLLLKLDGERVVGCVPELGYLHRGYEKLAENMTYYEYIPHTDRLDYLATMANNVHYVLAVEKLAGIDIPDRAKWIRMIVAELSRIASHLIGIGAMAMDVGALTILLWSLREREKIQSIFDKVCGARFTTSYTRIGGVASDIDDEGIAMIKKFIDEFPSYLHEMEKLLHTNKIFLDRCEGLAYISKEDAIAIGFTGPNLRGSGVEWDLRVKQPYLFYDKVDFKVPTYTEGDALARYYVRVDETLESCKIIRQCLEKMQPGSIIANEPKKVLPKKEEIYTRMEELIHDFMLVNFGMNPPKGNIYAGFENPKGELGFYIVSQGKGYPWKLKIRSPSFNNLQALPMLVKGHLVSDVVAIIGSIDPVMGEADK